MLKFIASLLAFSSISVYAHRIRVFVAPEGERLVGYAYISGGSKLSGAEVQVFGPNQKSLATLKTDAEGGFSYRPKTRCSHRFVVDAGDGHRAEYTVEASELPVSLGPVSGKKSSVQQHEPAATEKERIAPGIVQLQAQIHSLQRQLEEHDAHVRLRDVLGGLGYILGIMGIVFYMKVRKSRAS